jgi:hypothetical protein
MTTLRKHIVGKDVVAAAVKALDTSIASILTDDAVVRKADKILASVNQFSAYLRGKGVDAAAIEKSALAVVEKYSGRKETAVDPTIEKIDRAARQGERLTELIEKTATDMGISKSEAADVVLMSPAISEWHRAEARLHELQEQEKLNKRFDEMAKLNSKNAKPESDFPLRSPAWLNNRTNTDTDANRVDVPNQQRTKPQGPGEDVGKLIEKIADGYVKAGMSRAKAVEMASMHKDVVANHQAEKARKMSDYAAMHTARENGPGRNALASTL